MYIGITRIHDVSTGNCGCAATTRAPDHSERGVNLFVFLVTGLSVKPDNHDISVKTYIWLNQYMFNYVYMFNPFSLVKTHLCHPWDDPCAFSGLSLRSQTAPGRLACTWICLRHHSPSSHTHSVTVGGLRNCAAVGYPRPQSRNRCTDVVILLPLLWDTQV